MIIEKQDQEKESRGGHSEKHAAYRNIRGICLKREHLRPLDERQTERKW